MLTKLSALIGSIGWYKKPGKVEKVIIHKPMKIEGYFAQKICK